MGEEHRRGRTCWTCGRHGHLSNNCPSRCSNHRTNQRPFHRTESRGRSAYPVPNAHSSGWNTLESSRPPSNTWHSSTPISNNRDSPCPLRNTWGGSQLARHTWDSSLPLRHPCDSSPPIKHAWGSSQLARHTRDISLPLRHPCDSSRPMRHARDSSQLARHTWDSSLPLRHPCDSSRPLGHAWDSSRHVSHTWNSSRSTRHKWDSSRFLVESSKPPENNRTRPRPSTHTRENKRPLTNTTEELRPPTLPTETGIQESTIRGDEGVDRVEEVLRKHLPDRGLCHILREKKFWYSAKESKTLLSSPPSPKRDRHRCRIAEESTCDYVPGDFDVLILHRQQGCILLEIKATGDEKQETESIRVALQKGIDRLVKGRKALETLQLNQALQLSNSGPVNIATTLGLPNLPRQLLKQVLDQYVNLKEVNFFQEELSLKEGFTLVNNVDTMRESCVRAFERCCKQLRSCICPESSPFSTIPVEVESLCLCSDDLPHKDGIVDPADERVAFSVTEEWWSELMRVAGSTPNLEDRVYTSLLQCFSTGENTETVRGSMSQHQKLRIFSQEQQDAVESAEQYVFLAGPPGSGKSLVLAQKVVHWQHDQEKVFIVYKYGETTTQPAVAFLHHLVREIQEECNTGTHPSSKLTVLGLHTSCDVDEFLDKHVLGGSGEDAESLTSSAQSSVALHKGRGVNFVIDEVSKKTRVEGQMFDLIAAVKAKLPQARIWCAGALPSYCPTGLTLKLLTHSYRCPFQIQRLLGATEPFPKGDGDHSNVFDYVTSCTNVGKACPVTSSGRRLRLPRSSPEPHFISHSGHGDKGEIWDCRNCCDSLAGYLKSLITVGADDPPEGSLGEKDVLLVVTGTHLYRGLDDIQNSYLYKQHMTSHCDSGNGHKTTTLTCSKNRNKAQEAQEETGQFRVKIVKQDDEFDPQSSAMSLMHVRTVAGLEAGVVVFLPCRRYQHTAPATGHTDKLDQCGTITADQRQRLSSLGPVNRLWFWYAASRSLSHLVVCHF